MVRLDRTIQKPLRRLKKLLSDALKVFWISAFAGMTA
jgi:hypothetical protein